MWIIVFWTEGETVGGTAGGSADREAEWVAGGGAERVAGGGAERQQVVLKQVGNRWDRGSRCTADDYVGGL